MYCGGNSELVVCKTYSSKKNAYKRRLIDYEVNLEEGLVSHTLQISTKYKHLVFCDKDSTCKEVKCSVTRIVHVKLNAETVTLELKITNHHSMCTYFL